MSIENPTPEERARVLAQLDDMIKPEPRLDYFTAKHMISAILAMVLDEEFDDYLEFETMGDGMRAARAVGEDGHWIVIGGGSITDDKGTRVVPVDYRAHAVDRAFELEAIHRAELAHWANLPDAAGDA